MFGEIRKVYTVCLIRSASTTRGNTPWIVESRLVLPVNQATDTTGRIMHNDVRTDDSSAFGVPRSTLSKDG